MGNLYGTKWFSGCLRTTLANARIHRGDNTRQPEKLAEHGRNRFQAAD
ncbi:hypothetical protein [Kingella oralis]|uniref:Uncharacterized protein n=1 Tax=Kingella oralis ATCC 51147 TaxID=629741 RepID=C4GJI6_9NEIS|nr:hypothetical protein [Kingella oralis]EEP67957.1 hypothetical protein GCWU000324_02208 [Kingella oralis ATCC 51147]QMT43253.1 hypothetical protein H3L93_02605 [Kingella oralis]